MDHLLTSPDDRLSLKFELLASGQPAWSLKFDGKTVLDPSPISLLTASGLLADSFRFLSSRVSAQNETFPILSGKASIGLDQHNQLETELSHPSGHKLTLIFRLSNEGAAMRWQLSTPGNDLQLIAENITFRFTDNHPCWAIDLPNFRTSFEGEYPPQRLKDLLPGQRKGLPLLVQTPNAWAALMEASVKDHSGIYLTGEPSAANSVVTQLSPILVGGDGVTAVRGGAEHTSPWRVILIAEKPANLIKSTFIHSLNPPCALEDTRWIRPGKVTWDWWCGPVAPGEPFEAGMNTRTFEHFVDFAAAMNLEYCMIDGGWYGGTDQGGGEDITRSVPELDVPHIISYAAAKGVSILLWLHSQDLRGKVDQAFAYYESIGVKGLKIDFFDRCDQDIIGYCHELLEKGAKHHLLLNFHGIFCPVGWERTYPHLLTMEGVLGAEYNKWSSRVTPEHNTTLPFTRMLTGPMDYTVGVFTHATADSFEPRNRAPMSVGTRAQNLAMFVVYESGFQMVSDHPGAILNQPGSEFVKQVPATWDETLPLDGAVGEYIVLARRKGDTWFVGGMTNSERREIQLSLDFIEGEWAAEIYQDGIGSDIDPAELAIDSRTVVGGSVLNFRLAPTGGFAVILRPTQPE